MKSFLMGVAMSALLLGAAAFASNAHPIWTGTWLTSPAATPPGATFGILVLPPRTHITGTIRNRLRVSLGGNQIRLRFSNEYGDAPMTLNAVSVGLAASGLDAAPGSLLKVTFGGNTAVTMPPGTYALSDAVHLQVSDLSDVVVSVYTRNDVAAFECKLELARPDQAILEVADATLTEHLPSTRCLFTMRSLISGVDVLTPRSRKVVVALGDSITDGQIDATTGERGWPGVLSRRLAPAGISVVNAGIAGNRLLQSIPMFGASALSRLDRDVFTVPGVTHVALLEGINDIGLSGPESIFGDTPLVQPDELISGYRQIAARAHERGIKVIGATILPFAGAFYYTKDREAVRKAVNQWIRTSKVFDAVIDFDAALRDPQSTERLKADYDVGDHLHPSAAGYRKMSDIIDPSIFD